MKYLLYELFCSRKTGKERNGKPKLDAEKYFSLDEYPRCTWSQLRAYQAYLQQRVQDGCENASLLWQELCQQGFPYGYKVVNRWLREYLGKPGRHSSEQEKAKRQSFLAVVEAENGPLALPKGSLPQTEQAAYRLSH